MSRVHRVTHPVIGPATWAEIQAAAAALLRETGVMVCSWCHQPVPKGNKTRCGDPVCAERIWQAYSWNRCRGVVLRAAKRRCALCSNWASEVDHIKPVSLGGTGDLDNLRALCDVCHAYETRRLRKHKKGFTATTT